jgi:hypothetical protein
MNMCLDATFCHSEPPQAAKNLAFGARQTRDPSPAAQGDKIGKIALGETMNMSNYL